MRSSGAFYGEYKLGHLMLTNLRKAGPSLTSPEVLITCLGGDPHLNSVDGQKRGPQTTNHHK